MCNNQNLSKLSSQDETDENIVGHDYITTYNKQG
jgi:hypothetical protein